MQCLDIRTEIFLTKSTHLFRHLILNLNPGQLITSDVRALALIAINPLNWHARYVDWMRFLIRSVLDDPSILYKVTYCVIRLYKDWRKIFLLKIMKFNCFPEKKNLDDLSQTLKNWMTRLKILLKKNWMTCLRQFGWVGFWMTCLETQNNDTLEKFVRVHNATQVCYVSLRSFITT